MRKTVWFSAVGLALLAVVGSLSCGYLLTKPVQLTGRVIVGDLPQGQWDGTEVVLVGISTTYTDANGVYTFDGHVTGDDRFELIISRPGYDSWRFTGTFPHGGKKDETAVVTVEDITLTRL